MSEINLNFKIIYQFLKDISFESPNVPDLFFKKDNTDAKITINIPDINVSVADNNLYMIDLKTTVHANLEKENKTIFLIESVYSALVQLENNDNEELNKRILFIKIPELLFPFIRSLITRLTSESGFPTFNMQNVDFEKKYEEYIKTQK